MSPSLEVSQYIMDHHGMWINVEAKKDQAEPGAAKEQGI